MSFYSRYELVKLVRNGEPKSFQARDVQSGRNVLLHLWGMGEASKQSPLLLRLRDQMRTDPAALMGAVVEIQESVEPPYVVTTFEEEFTDLEQWLDRKLSAASAAPPPVAAPVPTPPPVVVEPQPPKAEPDEFARMFGNAPSEPAAAQPISKTEPGEFTRLFVAVRPSAPPIAPLSDPVPLVPPQPVATPAASPQAPGEFTRMFAAPVIQPTSPILQPPAHSPLASGATGLFSTSDRPGAMPSGSIEFTPVLPAPQPQPAWNSAPAGAVPLPAPPKQSGLPGVLVALLTFLLILLLIAVVVLIFRK